MEEQFNIGKPNVYYKPYTWTSQRTGEEFSRRNKGKLYVEYTVDNEKYKKVAATIRYDNSKSGNGRMYITIFPESGIQGYSEVLEWLRKASLRGQEVQAPGYTIPPWWRGYGVKIWLYRILYKRIGKPLPATYYFEG